MKITPETLRQLLDYNAETGELTWRHRPTEFFPSVRVANSWNARYANASAFTSDDGRGYRQGAIFGKMFRAHRVVWALVTGKWPNGEIDHLNGQRADNRWTNLRDVSRSINNRNTKRHSHNTSGYSGVFFHEKTGRWRASIKADQKQIHLGCFGSKEDALVARKLAETERGS